MNSIGRTIRLEINQIRNRRTFRLAFEQVMDYPDWYSRNLDEWIELISVHEQANNRFQSANSELFLIEVPEAQELASSYPKPFLSMIATVNRVNERYMEKLGKPILALVLL